MTKKLKLSIEVNVDLQDIDLQSDDKIDAIVHTSISHVYAQLLYMKQINTNIVRNGVISKTCVNDTDKLWSKLTLELVDFPDRTSLFLQTLSSLSSEFVNFSIGYMEGDEYYLTALGERLTGYIKYKDLSNLLISLDRTCGGFSEIMVSDNKQLPKRVAMRVVDEIARWKSQHFPGEALVVE